MIGERDCRESELLVATDPINPGVHWELPEVQPEAKPAFAHLDPDHTWLRSLWLRAGVLEH